MILNIESQKNKSYSGCRLRRDSSKLWRFSRFMKKYDLKLIADCAQSIGSKYKDLNSCEYADFTAYSFNNKTITTSDGGMLSIKDPNLYEKLKD